MGWVPEGRIFLRHRDRLGAQRDKSGCQRDNGLRIGARDS